MRISIVEDEQAQRELLQSYIDQYSRESGVTFEVETFADGRDLLADYHRSTTSSCWTSNCRHERHGDRRVHPCPGRGCGADVHHQHGPVRRGRLRCGRAGFRAQAHQLQHLLHAVCRAIKRAGARKSGQILLNLPDCVRRIETQQIYYIEVMNKMLHYHTQVGEFVLRGTMQSVENELSR